VEWGKFVKDGMREKRKEKSFWDTKKENFFNQPKNDFYFPPPFPSKENKPSPHVAIVSYFKKDEKEAGRPKI